MVRLPLPRNDLVLTRRLPEGRCDLIVGNSGYAPATGGNTDLTFEQSIPVFLQDRQNHHRKSGTIVSYRNHLEHCHEYGVDLYGCEFTLRDAVELPAEYLAYRTHEKRAWDDNEFVPTQDRNLSLASVATTYRTLQAFWNRMQKLGHITVLANPFALDMVPFPESDDLIPDYLNDDEIVLLDRLMAVTDHAERNVALYRVLLDTGARIGEILGAVLRNLDRRNHILRVLGKGGREREIIYSVKTAGAVESYLATRANLAPQSPLFLDVSGEPLRYGGARMIMRRAYERAQIDLRRCGLHILRHTFARKYLLNGGDLASLSQLMGHSSIKTTMIYARFITPDLQRKHAQCSPVDELLSEV